MAEVKPYLQTIQPWDATKGVNVYFTYTGSKQAIDNHLQITDVSSGLIVYSFEWSSFEKTHPIPPSQLINGKVYKAKLRVKFGDGTYSPYSNEVEFRTFAMPVLDITSIDGQGYVYNRDVTFAVSYTQANGEKVKTYRFSLYDENEDLIQNYPIRIPVVENELTEVVSELEKNKGYFVECSIETINGMIYTHRERFIPMYIVPSVNGLITTENDAEEGFIRITANLKQILGTQVKGTSRTAVDENYNPDTYTYIDNDWIVIPPDKPLMFKGLGMNRASDFVLKVWCKDIPTGKKFLEISPVDNEGIGIQLWKYADRIVATKEFNGVSSRYRSNIISIPTGAEYMVFVKAIEHRLELSLQIM